MQNSSCLCRGKPEKFTETIVYKNETVFKNFEGTVIGRCTKCGLLKTFPAKKNSLFEPKQSRENMYEKDREKFQAIFHPLIRSIKKYKSSGRVLDVGCSSGILMSLIEKEGYDIYGIEPNKQAYTQAKNKFGDKVFNGTLTEYFQNRPAKFDCIIYNHVFEHIEDVNGEIDLIKKIMNRDAVLIVGVPNSHNLIFWLRRKYWEPLMPNEHIWHFSSGYLIRLLRKHGLKVIAQSFEDDKRSDYPLVKKLYFRSLSAVNKLLRTGEAVLLTAKVA